MISPETVQLLCVATILAIVALVIFERIWSGRGIGVRAIQFVVGASIVPFVIAMTLAGKMDTQLIGVTIGTLIGYLFGSISKFDERR